MTLERLWLTFLRRVGPARRSLARLASEEMRRARTSGRGDSARAVWSWVGGFTQRRWILLFWVAIALVPLDGPSWPGAEDFLREAWQVVTGTIAISLALQVFALERFAGSREASYGGGVLEFAKKTRLLGVFYVGIAAILVNGVALLELGAARADGWAGTYSVLLSAFAIALLPMLLPELLHEAGLDAARRRRLAGIRDGVTRAVAADALDRVAAGLLGERTTGRDVRFEPAALPAREGEVTVRAAGRGVVEDVDLGLIDQLAASVTNEPIRIHKRLHDEVWEREALVTLPAAVAAWARAVGNQVVTVGPLQEDALSIHKKQLAAEGLAIARTRDVFAHEDVLEGYGEMLLAFPRTWRTYRSSRADRIAAYFEPARLPTDDEAVADLAEFIADAAQGPSHRIARQAVYAPVHIAFGAIQLGADELMRRMATLLVTVYRAVRPSAEGQATLVADLVSEYLPSIARYDLAPRVEDDARSFEEREHAGELMKSVFGAIAELLRAAVDAADEGTIRKLDTEWSELLQHWDVTRNGYDLTDAEQFAYWREGRDAAEIQAAERVVRLHEALEERRELERFGVAMWALWRHRRAEGQAAVAPAVSAVLGRFGSIEAVAPVLEHALALTYADALMSRWTRWLTSDRGRGPFAFAPDLEVLRAGLTMMAMRSDPGRPPTIRPRPWLVNREVAVGEILDLLAGDPRFALLVPQEQARDRVESLRRGIADATTEQREIGRRDVATTPLRADAVEGLVAGVRVGWRSHRLVPGLFRQAGVVVDQTMDRAGAVALSHRASMDRTILQTDRPGEPERIGTEIGRELTEREFAVLVELLRTRLPSTPIVGDPRAAIVAAVGELRAAGLEPRLILKPTSWRLERALALREPGAPPPALPDWWGFPAEAGHWYRGMLDRIAVFDSQQLKNEVIIVDLAAAGAWTEVIPADRELVSVSIDEPAARGDADPAVVVTATALVREAVGNAASGRALALPPEAEAASA